MTLDDIRRLNIREAGNWPLLPKIMIEVVIQNEVVDDVIKTIIETARTGEIGDGRVFLIPIEQGYNIRTGERDVV